LGAEADIDFAARLLACRGHQAS